MTVTDDFESAQMRAAVAGVDAVAHLMGWPELVAAEKEQRRKAEALVPDCAPIAHANLASIYDRIVAGHGPECHRRSCTEVVTDAGWWPFCSVACADRHAAEQAAEATARFRAENPLLYAEPWPLTDQDHLAWEVEKERGDA